MSDREPVNIMGVIAFPNPNKDERVIRFIDSEYHTLFTIKDGESIVIIQKCGGHPDGGYAQAARAGGALPQHRLETVGVSERDRGVAGGAR